MIILSIIDCCYKCVNGCTDDVRVDAGAPGIRFLKCIADSIQTTITSCFCGDCRSIKSRGYLSNNSSVFLLEMNLIDAVRTDNIFECRFKQTENLIRMKFLVTVVRYCLCCISNSFARLRRQVQTIFCLQDIS